MSNGLNVIDLVAGNAWEGGADGYIFKAGQGQLEYQWRHFAALAEAEAKPWGLYWLVDARYSPESHKAAIKAAFPDGDFGELGLWLDIEKPVMDMEDDEYRALPYDGYKPVESVWRGVEAYTGVYPGMYFGPASWDLIMSGAPPDLQAEFAAHCECWIAHYTHNPQPDMRGKWDYWAMWQWREGPDYNRVDTRWWNQVVSRETVYILRRPLTAYAVAFTPGLGDPELGLPLMNAVEHAAAHGWECCINGGAGFEYTDESHAIPKGPPEFDTVMGIPYAERLVRGGTVEPGRDNSYVAPWSILGFDAERVYLLVTEGTEGGAGMTKRGAADWCKNYGMQDAYLMDSGHSSQIEERGTMLYWPYGPAEEVPQGIGLIIKTTSGGSMKGVCNPGKQANIKSELTSAILHVMTGGEYIFGEWANSQHTDLWHFDHYYTAAGVKTPLPVMCKVSVGTNLTVTSEAEPTEPPIDPPPAENVPHLHQTFVDNNGATWVFDADGIKQ